MSEESVPKPKRQRRPIDRVRSMKRKYESSRRRLQNETIFPAKDSVLLTYKLIDLTGLPVPTITGYLVKGQERYCESVIAEICREAELFSMARGSKVITGEDIQNVLAAREYTT